MLKNRAPKINKISKKNPKWVPKSEGILGEMPLGAPLVAQTASVIRKWAPSAPKVRSRIEKWAKNDTKELPECKKWTPKVDPFPIQARQTARSAHNNLPFAVGLGPPLNNEPRVLPYPSFYSFSSRVSLHVSLYISTSMHVPFDMDRNHRSHSNTMTTVLGFARPTGHLKLLKFGCSGCLVQIQYLWESMTPPHLLPLGTSAQPNQPSAQPTNQPINQSTNQPINQWHHRSRQ